MRVATKFKNLAPEAANEYNYSSFFLRINLISQFQTGIVKNIDKK